MKSTSWARHRSMVLRVAGAVMVATAATAALAQQGPPAFSKAFQPDVIGPGSVAVLRFDISNLEGGPVTELAFTDTLPAGVAIASPAGASTTCGGELTAVDGGGTISLSGGSLGTGAVCSVLVNVTSATVGTHMNISGDLTSSAGNSGNAADDLTVAADRPGFSKAFSPGSVPFGGRSTLTFTVDNTANQSDVSLLSFADTLPPGMVVASPANASTDCQSTLQPATLTAVPGTSLVSLTAQGSLPPFQVLAAGATCTVAVDVIGGAVGTLVNTSGELTSASGFPNRSSGAATAALEVTATPIALVKSFTDDPVPPGGTVELQFTLANLHRSADASAITFSDDLDATLSGLTAMGLPMAGVCGPGSQLAGTGVLTLTGGTLAAEARCSFSVTLQVPAGAATGAYPNTTSSVSADHGGVPVSGTPGADILFVAPAPRLTKEFTDDPALPGGTATLRFTIENLSAIEAATDIVFQDALSGVLGGLTAIGLPLTDICGAGSSLTGLSGNTVLSFQAGSLGPGASCQFDVTLHVPAVAASGTYPNTTSGFRAFIGGTNVFFPNAADQLEVSAEQLALSKEFTDDPVAPGGTATLQFTLTNLHPSLAATGITFTDDLGAALAGLTAVGLPAADVCGAGSQISGTSLLTFTGGNLPAGGSCTFSVLTQVPASVPWGAAITNVTSAPSGSMSGLPVTGGAASGDLTVEALGFSKSFAGPANPGGRTTLTFVIQNLSTGSGVAGLAFTDDLEAVLAGMQAVGLPAVGVCGPGSEIAGTSLLSLRDGVLGPGESCTFEVEVEIPLSAALGSYANVTSELFVAGVPSAAPATAPLEVEAAAAPAAIPAATPLGSLLLAIMITTAAAWLLRIRS